VSASDGKVDFPVLLDFEQVSVTSDDGVELLHSVSAHVHSRDILVIAGPSGAGKSTLLRLGNRLDVPSAGQVFLAGTDIATLDPLWLRRRVGMVFQKPSIFPGTVRDNLLVAAPDADEIRMTSVLVRVGLVATFLDRIGDDLSGGEMQRVCIARALLTDPEVLLMDEPTSALDPGSRRGIEFLARELADEGLGILWVTHDLAQARRLADRTLVLVDGRLATESVARAYLDDAADSGEMEQ
jgi:putative ABC transport system ATP-binding protein